MANETLPLPLGPRPQGKRCKRCSKVKPLSEFHYRPEQLRHRAECKDCYRAAMNARRDPIDNRRRVKEWQKANPEKKAAQAKRSHETRRTNLGRWLGKTLLTTRSYCKRKNILCSVTSVDLVALYARQEGRCALTGRELIWGSKGVQRDSLSIDQIEHQGGYVIGNIRLVTYQANFARNRFSDEELFAFCEAVLATSALNIKRPSGAAHI